MSPELIEALTLLGIGMVTVFLVLSLVVLTGRCLIILSNTFSGKQTESQDDISEEVIAVINAAVEVATKGKGTVAKIEKK